MKLQAMFYFFQKYNLIFFLCRDVFESAALISPSAILDFHSQHSVHSAPGSRMDGMAFCSFRNRNADGEGKRRKEFAEWNVERRAEWHNYAK